MLEMCGIGLIYPFLEILRNPDSIANFPVLKNILSPFLFDDPNKFFWVLGVALVIAYIIKNLCLLLLIYLQNRFAKNRIALISHKMLEGYLALPYTFHLQKNTADLLRNIENSVIIVFNKGAISLLYIFMESMVATGLIILLLFIDPISTIAVTLILSVGLGSFYGVMKIRLSLWGKKEHDLIAEIYKWVHQSIGAIKEMKVLGRELFFSYKFSEAVIARAQPQIAYGTVKQSPRVFFEIFLIIGMLVVFWITYMQNNSLDSVLTILTMFAVVSIRLLPSINRIASSLIDLKSSGPALDVLYKDYEMILNNQKNKDQDFSNETVFSFKKNINFKNVSFSYPGSTDLAVQNIDLQIKCGETIGIVGPTGSGKTTLIDILLGLLPPSKGILLVDGSDIYKNLRGWQKQIGYVPQKIYLTDDTLRRNIAFGFKEEEIDNEKIKKAIQYAHLTNFISNLPKGLDTRVGEQGVRLSGGESQRVGIARALYQNPEILVMDEATSSLDNETEHEIAKSINEIAQSKTLVIVAHRLSTIKECDFLIFIKNGVIIDKGPFHEIQTRSPEFQRQVRLGTFAKTS